VINALTMAASYDPDPTQSLGIRLPVTFDTCELYIDCGEKDEFNLLYGLSGACDG
jgi:hypothetical protein